jgi:hypothetical protein
MRHKFLKTKISWILWCMHVIPTLRRQKQADCRKFEAPGICSAFQVSLGYIARLCLKKPIINKNKNCKLQISTDRRINFCKFIE